MLNPKQIRMCQLLDKQISNCEDCALNIYGKCVPYWNPKNEFAIIGPSPTYIDIKKNTFFSGQVGDILMNELALAGFKASQFLILNSVQCGKQLNTNLSIDHLDACKNYVRKYLKVVRPEKVLCLGNYAQYMFTGRTIGIKRIRGGFEKFDLGNGVIIPVLFTINPSVCLYNREQGIEMLKEDISIFKNAKFERKSDWEFSLDDFLI